LLRVFLFLWHEGTRLPCSSGKSGKTAPRRRRHGSLFFLGFAFWVLEAGLALARGPAPADVPLAELPREAHAVLARIKRGGPFPYHRDGAIFGNFERRLPIQYRGYYREYTVATPGASDRGARRIVAGAGPDGDVRTSGEYYYTADHYRTFRRIRE
jgi:ribonuclease T1